MSSSHTPQPRLVEAERDLLRFTTAGSVDDGKSTLIGRMLFDTKQIFQDQMEALESASRLRGEEQVNLALLTDGLRAEREQGITIDVAYRYFSTARRKFIIADTPGHEQYTRNMVTGASTADLAIVLIDARNGVLTQSRRHGIIASLLGIPHIVVAVNKMDLVNYSQDRFNEIVADYTAFAQKLRIHDLRFIPVSALNGDNVVDRSDRMPWYEGHSLLHLLETITISADRNLVDFRFPVQYVIRPHQDFRGFAGRITSGTIAVGEQITVLPSLRRSRVASISVLDVSVQEAFAPQSVVLTLEDEIDISRGDMIVRSHNLPEVTNEFEATVCWMDERNPLKTDTQYLLQHTTRVTKVFADHVRYRIDVNSLHRDPADQLNLNEIGRIKFTTSQPLFFDPYDRNRETGGFILIDAADFRTVGAGMIRYTTRETLREFRREQGQPADRPAADNIHWESGEVTQQQREQRNGHKPLCVWLTGLSGSGKSTIARALEQALFAEGKQVFRLDGDNVRHGLCSDLGFSREDRATNIRRVGHAARLLFDAGNVVICSFIAPYAIDRDFVRSLFPEHGFLEIAVRCPIDVCRTRDPKGLYRKADAGEITGFTGVDDPYEEPVNPDLVVDTAAHSVSEVVARVRSAIQERL